MAHLSPSEHGARYCLPGNSETCVQNPIVQRSIIVRKPRLGGSLAIHVQPGSFNFAQLYLNFEMKALTLRIWSNNMSSIPLASLVK